MVVDMSKMTCAELTRLGFQDFAGITMWMSGYYSASARNTVIDLDRFGRQDGEGLLRDRPSRQRNVHRRSGARHQDAARSLALASTRGSTIRNTAPRWPLFFAEIVPSCESMMVRAMDNPMPIPLGFVV